MGCGSSQKSTESAEPLDVKADSAASRQTIQEGSDHPKQLTARKSQRNFLRTGKPGFDQSELDAFVDTVPAKPIAHPGDVTAEPTDSHLETEPDEHEQESSNR